MFKDLYKQANEKIDTLDAKARVMKKIACPAPVRKSYPVARVAALAACFVLTVAAAGIYENMQKEIDNPLEIPTTNIEVVTKTDASPVAAYGETETTKRETKASPTTKNSVANREVIANETTLPVKEQDTDSVLADTATPEVTEENASEAALAIEPVAQEEHITSGSGGVAMARMAESDMVMFEGVIGEAVEVSPEEYCEYLGKNIPEIAQLPDGVEDHTKAQQLLADDNGNYIDDTFTFLFEGSGKIITIKTTKNMETILENPENEMVLNEQFEADGIGYAITATNCTEDEFEKIVFSLK